MSNQTPLWKRAFNAVERPLATRLESAVRTDAAFDAIAAATRAMRATSAARRTPIHRAPPAGVSRWVGNEIDKGLHRLRNGVRVLADVDPPALGVTPAEEVWADGRARLLRYESHQRTGGPPVIIVPSLVATASLFDLQPTRSAVRYLLQAGCDVLLLDWGVADARDASNDLSTYVDAYLPHAVSAACDAAGSEQAHLVAHCFGGVLALLYTAAHPEHVRSLAALATPVDWGSMGPLAELTREGRLEAADLTDGTGNVPAETIKGAFRIIQPTAQVAGIANLLQHLDNDAFVQNYRAVAAWSSTHLPSPRPLL